MNFGAILDWCVLVGGDLIILWVGLIPLEVEVGNIVVYGYATGALGVVPLEIDAGVQVTLLFFSDILVFFEGISKVVGVAVTYVFNTKFVDNEVEEDRAPFMDPDTRSGGALVVSVFG